MTDARVRLWGRDIGAVTWIPDRDVAVFQYDPEFAGSRIQVAPLTMPLSPDPYEFPALPRVTFRGLPGLLADSLPDAFGNAVIDAWLEAEGRTADSMDPVERLCYVGTRGMGALEFEPAISRNLEGSDVRVERLVELANLVLAQRSRLTGTLTGEGGDALALEQILKVSTSAGGARAKAVLGWNPATGAFRSGQISVAEGFEHWILKFDGVDSGATREIGEPRGYGRIEYAYALMASDAGVTMTDCRLHHEQGRAHFMTRRFDRTPAGGKVHMQSLGAMRHFDFNRAGAHSYEQAIQTGKRLDLTPTELRQQFRRAAFNVVARNQDDHVKNVAYLMDRRGRWTLSPAFDVVYAYNPAGHWTRRHQMSINGKTEDIDRTDLVALGAVAGLKRAKALDVISEVVSSVRDWSGFASSAGVSAEIADRIGRIHRVELA